MLIFREVKRMVEDNKIKRAIALLFILFLFIGFFRNNSYAQLQKIADYLGQDIESLDSEQALTIDTLESEYAEGMPSQQDLIDLNGSLAKTLKMKNLYSNMGIYITDNLYIVSASPYTTTDYEFEQTVNFKRFLDENHINLLYVNEPTKYDDDSLFRDEFGIESYSNRNTDTFLSRLRSAGVNTIDLRESIKDEGINIFDMFYRTDHHWTTKAALWAAQKIAVGLNTYCGYHIDTSLYHTDNYTFTEWQECWLGEQGRKVANSYVGLDDFTEIKPNFTTSYTFKSKNGNYEGTFDDFIEEDVYNLENNVYENKSWHYSYSKINCTNHKIDDGKILILGDSYEQVTEPFISLGIHEVDVLVLRQCDSSFNLRNYILENGYDTVIICYAQFMVGAHDNKSSANYRMFKFE